MTVDVSAVCLKTVCSILCNQINLTLCLVMGLQRLSPDILASHSKWVAFILSHAFVICLLDYIFVHFVPIQVNVQQQPTCMTVTFPLLVPGKDIAWMCTFMYCHVYIFEYIYIWRLVRRSIEQIKYVNIYLCQSVYGILSGVYAMCSVFFFSLSWFYVTAPPLRPSLPSLLTVHNLIKGQQHGIMIR